jgi:hypothetical protein
MNKKMLAMVAPGLLLAGTAHAALVVSNAPTQNVSCAAAVCTATAADAVLNVRDLLVLLKRNDTSIVSGSSAMDIAFDAGLHWTAPTRLTIDAYRSVTFSQPVMSLGSGGVALTFNDGGSGGDLFFANKGRLAFWDTHSVLRINGRQYRLVKDVATLSADAAANPEGFYALANNYDASSDGPYANSPVANVAGTVEGLGNTISHLTINGCCGLVHSLGNNSTASTLRDIVLAGEIVRVNDADRDNTKTGGLVGYFEQGTIVGASIVGGSIYASSGWVGGLVGFVDVVGARVIRSHSSARVLCRSDCFAGGLIGLNSGYITLSSASGIVKGSHGSFVGGLVGGNGGFVSLSFATGAVTVTNGKGGGLIGDNFFCCGPVGVDHSFATGPVTVVGTADTYAGGFVGRGATATIKQSYSIGFVSGVHFGGFVGYDEQHGSGPLYNYWDLDTSGVSDPSRGAGNIPNDIGITGLATVQFQSGLPNGFDPAVWGQNPTINNGYPYLLANPPQ